MLESLFNKIEKKRNFNIAEFLRAPVLKDICE